LLINGSISVFVVCFFWKPSSSKLAIPFFAIGVWSARGGADELHPKNSRQDKDLLKMEKIAQQIGEVIQRVVETHPVASVAGILAAVPSLLQEKATMHISGTVYLNRLTPQLGATNPHIDRHDCHGCFVVPFGDYAGGEVTFPQLAQTVRLPPGDCLWFDSSQMQHHNAPVTAGTRFSMVFATHTQVIRIAQNIPSAVVKKRSIRCVKHRTTTKRRPAGSRSRDRKLLKWKH